MVQEFSTILIHSRERCEAYLDAVVPACRENGANGFLWWCLRDIEVAGYPYDKSGFEGRLGLVDAQDRPKPATAKLIAMLTSLRDAPPPPPAARISPNAEFPPSPPALAPPKPEPPEPTVTTIDVLPATV